MKKIYEYDEEDIKQMIANKLGLLSTDDVYFLIENNGEGGERVKVCAIEKVEPKTPDRCAISAPNSACLYH